MPSWKKVIVSGSQAHLQGITASNLTNNTSAPTPRVVGYDPTTGIFSYFNTSSIAPTNTIDGAGVGQRLTMWSDSNTITTASIYASTDANPRYLIGYTDTAGSPVFAGRLNVSGSSGNEGIVVGSRVSTDINSYGTYVFSDTEGPKIGFGSYTVAAATTPLSASWAQIGAYNQALRFEAFTTGSHVLSGGILFSYSGSNRPDLKISASNGATLVGINTNTPTNTLEVNGGITAVNISASGNISGSGNLTITGNETIGGTSTITGRLTANGAITTTNITASGNISSSAGLIGATLTTSGNGTIGGNLTVTGDLTVNGTTTTIDTSNLTVEDKFIILAHGSGSIAPIQEGGIIIEGSTADSGQAFIFNSGSTANVTGRWGVAAGIHATSSDVTPTEYMVTAITTAGAPSAAPTYGGSAGGYGNIYVNSTDESIWIYS